MGLKADFSGALHKMSDLKTIPRATKRIGQEWLAVTRKELQRSAADMQKSIRSGRPKARLSSQKSGQMARNIGQIIEANGSGWTMGVGTGLGGTVSIKYARLQDEGGTTHPRVSPEMRKWAWAMYYQSFRTSIRGLGLRGSTKRGAFETFTGEGSVYKAIALTKKATLTVNVPASKWFTSVIDRREPILLRNMQPDHVLAVAKIMSGER